MFREFRMLSGSMVEAVTQCMVCASSHWTGVSSLHALLRCGKMAPVPLLA